MGNGKNYPILSVLDIFRVAKALQGAPVGHTIDYHGALTSTMQTAHELTLHPDTLSGALVVAEEQSAGQGRMQRRWEAPFAQGLLVSLILKGEQLPPNPAQLPMLAGIALVRAIAQVAPELADEIGLKWPNDVLLGEDLSTGEKVGGILIESSYRDGQLEYAIVGMGINVNQQTADLPTVPPEAPAPTSLRLHLGRPLDRADLLIALCTVWADLLGTTRGAHDIILEWRNLLYTLGQPVTVRYFGENGAILNGVAVDVTSDGELVVQDETGRTAVVSSGDVTCRPGAGGAA
jgi:BirA family biotin operon repressor/biotin-[acetyl-CoA-carboxylase] ligase